MTHARVATLTLALFVGLSMEAGAQLIMQGPFQAPAQPQQTMPPCMAEFLPLRNEAEKRAEKLKGAIAKKAQPPALCPLFRAFAEAEAKVVKYATTHQAACNV